MSMVFSECYTSPGKRLTAQGNLYQEKGIRRGGNCNNSMLRIVALSNALRGMICVRQDSRVSEDLGKSSIIRIMMCWVRSRYLFYN
jgi:hypothetical protein